MNTATNTAVKTAISTTALTKTYGKARGIENLNLTVEQGEFYGFIGPNGAGKSTTIRLLLGLLTPTSGSAAVLGMDICAHRQEILRATGYLPSEVSFYSGMKVKDVLRLSADLRKVPSKIYGLDLCERLQLDPSRKVDALSLGNRKKAAIVCALQHKPPLLILDEPTSGLDPLIQQEFFQILTEHNRDGATIFLSSHVLSEIQHHCTSAAIIREGRIVHSGPMADLIRSAAKRITLRTANPDALSNLAALPGVHNLQRQDCAASFLYSGDINQLVAALASLSAFPTAASPFTGRPSGSSSSEISASHPASENFAGGPAAAGLHSDHPASAGLLRDLTITEPSLEEVFLDYYADHSAAPTKGGSK